MAVLNRNAYTYRTYIKRVRKTPAGVVFGAAAAASNRHRYSAEYLCSLSARYRFRDIFSD